MNPHAHLIAMHTNDARDRLWTTCSCAWASGERLVTSEDGWHAIHRALVEEARSHYDDMQETHHVK